MSFLQFGMIRSGDIQPGFAMKLKSHDEVYVVKECTGEPVFRPARPTRISEEEWPAVWHVPFTADVYAKQADGSYLKTKEEKSPVGLFWDKTNPNIDPVRITRQEGNRIWIEV
jgi:hypothetical protein